MKAQSNSVSITDFLASTKLTIILLFLLGIASIIGTVVIQKGTGEEAHIPRVYSPQVIRIFESLGFFDIYHSGLYVGLLGLLGINLVVCTWRRFPKDRARIQAQRRFPPLRNLKKIKNFREISIPRTGDIQKIIEDAAGKTGYRVTQASGNSWIATKGSLGKYGFYIVHAGILIILTGGLLSSLFSIEGMLWLRDGEQADSFVSIHNIRVPLGFTIKSNRFTIDTYSNGMPKEYRTDLDIIMDGGRTIHWKLRVNHPITAGKYRFYQASYQPSDIKGAKMEIRYPGEKPSTFELGFPDVYEFKDKEGNTVRIESQAFEPDFMLNQDGEPGSKSNELNNPALLVHIFVGDNPPVPQWLFLKFPDFHGANQNLPFSLAFTGLVNGYATGIQVAYDPGTTVIWTGSVVIMIGLIMVFFIQQGRLWIALETSGAKHRILVAGAGPKTVRFVDMDIDRFVSRVMRAVEHSKGS